MISVAGKPRVGRIVRCTRCTGYAGWSSLIRSSSTSASNLLQPAAAGA